MKKKETMFIKNLRYLCLIGVIALGLMTIFGSNGDEDGDGGTSSAFDNSLGVGLTDDGSALVAADTDGEILVIEDGSVVFEGSNGENIVLSYGADGYPTRMVIGGNVICYDSWDTKNNTVNMGFVLADGTTTTEHDVEVDADTLARLKTLIASKPATSQVTGSAGALNLFDADSAQAPKALDLSNDDVQWAFSYAGTLLSAAGCGAAIGTAIGSGGISAPVVGLACASTVIYFATDLDLVDENNTALQATGTTLTAIDAVQCYGLDVGACAGLVLEGAETLAGSAETTEEGLADEIQIVETVIQYGGGSVQVTLSWKSEDDLDLYVVDPDSEEIYYGYTESESGGYLDHDDTDGGTSSEPAVENIYWESNAPSGSYTVSVNYYADYYPYGSTDYEVIVMIDGEIYDVYTGTLTSEDENDVVTTFTYSGS